MPVTRVHDCGDRRRRARRAWRGVQRRAWLLATLVVAFMPLPAGSREATRPHVEVAPETATAAGATPAVTKPLRQVVACLWMVLGIGGVLLAFATGAFAPVVAVLLAGVALEVCG